MTELDKSIALLENTLNEGFLKDAAKKIGAKIRKYAQDKEKEREDYNRLMYTENKKYWDAHPNLLAKSIYAKYANEQIPEKKAKPRTPNDRIVIGKFLNGDVVVFKNDITADASIEWYKEALSKINADAVKRVNNLKQDLIETMDSENEEYGFTTTIEGINNAFNKPYVSIDKDNGEVTMMLSFHCPDTNAHDVFYNDASLLLYIDYDADTYLYKDHEWQFSW